MKTSRIQFSSRTGALLLVAGLGLGAAGPAIGDADATLENHSFGQDGMWEQERMSNQGSSDRDRSRPEKRNILGLEIA